MLQQLRVAVACVCLMAAFALNGCSRKTATEAGDKPDSDNKTKAAKVELPKDFSLAKTWTGTYREKNVSFTFADDNTGTLIVEGHAGPLAFTYEEKRASSDRINAKIYFKKTKAFAKGSLKMYNAGKGFSMKLQYTGENEFKVYNGVFVQDGKIVVDDGPFTMSAR